MRSGLCSHDPLFRLAQLGVTAGLLLLAPSAALAGTDVATTRAEVSDLALAGSEIVYTTPSPAGAPTCSPPLPDARLGSHRGPRRRRKRGGRRRPPGRHRRGLPLRPDRCMRSSPAQARRSSSGTRAARGHDGRDADRGAEPRRASGRLRQRAGLGGAGDPDERSAQAAGLAPRVCAAVVVEAA